ncbi:DUF1120 domain-containing protein [Stenotrophomonas sp. VV52]|uniref:DUF1120 domain-containing protein n=1 Tax=Stenotrophomonas sp. VV52 TaxID=2066958 RepID=UPI000C9E9E7D|nr:DUF1120 domain-containing protein [Stenotrophomonas sp. VV52]
MKLSNTLFALMLVSAAPGALAQSADLSITGNIFPGACTVTLGGGGVADLGDIRTDTLSHDTTTELAPVDMSLGVVCESPVRFAFVGVDNAIDSTLVENQYGLGLTPAGEKIGGADIRFFDIDIDSARGYWTRSYNDGETWSPGDDVFMQPPLMQHYILGFTTQTGATTGPAPIKALQGQVRVVARIAPAAELTLTEDVAINGSATINLTYL